MDTPADLGTISGGSDYTVFLPNLLYNGMLTTIGMCLAFTQSLARPAYYDLVPYELSNSEDKELSLGNPDLNASLSSNIDAMVGVLF